MGDAERLDYAHAMRGRLLDLPSELLDVIARELYPDWNRKHLLPELTAERFGLTKEN